MSLSSRVDNINTLKSESPIFFNLCDDVSLIRYFYSKLIGLNENAYKKDSYVEYKQKGKTMMFYQADKIFKKLRSFNDTYNHEKVNAISWLIALEEVTFAVVVKRLLDSDAEILIEEPEWQSDGYWSFSVLDPMGNKVEIYMEPKKTPLSKNWSDKLSSNKKIARYIYQTIFKNLVPPLSK